MCVWFYTMIHSPMLFYANIFGLGGLFTYHGLMSEHEALKTQQECYSKLLRLVSATVDEVTNSDETPSEELLTSVLILSAYGHDFSSLRKTNPEFPEPADSAIDPYYFNLTTTNYCQTSALRTLVAKAGGISSIQTPGIAELICLHDLVISTSHITTPYFPRHWRSELFQDIPLPSTYLLQIWGLHNSDAQLDVLLRLRTLSARLNLPTTEDDTKDLNCARNEVQHRTLALPNSAFRIAALLFNDLVFFPSPAASCTRQRLVHSLRDLLPTGNLTPMMSLWTAMIGALASTGLVQQDEYFAQLTASRAQSLRIPSFADLQANLGEVVWQRKSLNQRSRSAWEQVSSQLNR